MATEQPADRNRRGRDISKLVGALPPETLRALGFTPPFLPIQTKLSQQMAAMMAVDSSGVQRLVGQLAGTDRLAAALVDTSSVQRLVGQLAGTDRLAAALVDTSGFQRLIGQIAGTNRLTAALPDTSGIQRLLGQLASTDRLAATLADTAGIRSLLGQVARTDQLTAALGKTLLVQHSFADLAGSAAFSKIAADATLFVETSRFHEKYFSQLQDLSERMSQQMGWLAGHRGLVLATPVLRANRAWQSAASAPVLFDAPETILDFGRSAQAINRAAYTIEVEETPSGEIWYVARATGTATDKPDSNQIDQLLGWLEGVDQKLPRKYKGAWNAIGQRGPDWISQGANSGMELLDWTLRTLAPDTEVIAWQQGTGMYGTEISEVTGKPHRSLRCRYIAHSRGLPARALEDLLKGVSNANKILQKIKHADDDTMAEALRSSLIALEYCLVIMWRGA